MAYAQPLGAAMHSQKQSRCCACRLLASAQALSTSEHSQQRLQQELAACEAALQDAVVRADAAHSEALSHLSNMRQQDRQADIDRLAMFYSVEECFMKCQSNATAL